MAQDPIKTAKIIKWLNVDQDDVEAEAPIKGLPTNSSIKVENPRIRRKPLIGAFAPTLARPTLRQPIFFAVFPRS